MAPSVLRGQRGECLLHALLPLLMQRRCRSLHWHRGGKISPRPMPPRILLLKKSLVSPNGRSPWLLAAQLLKRLAILSTLVPPRGPFCPLSHVEASLFLLFRPTPARLHFVLFFDVRPFSFSAMSTASLHRLLSSATLAPGIWALPASLTLVSRACIAMGAQWRCMLSLIHQHQSWKRKRDMFQQVRC